MSDTKTEVSAQTDPSVKTMEKPKVSVDLKEPTAICPGRETFSGFWCNCTWFWDKTFSVLASPGFPGGKKTQKFLFLSVHVAGERARQPKADTSLHWQTSLFSLLQRRISLLVSHWFWMLQYYVHKLILVHFNAARVRQANQTFGNILPLHIRQFHGKGAREKVRAS